MAYLKSSKQHTRQAIQECINQIILKKYKENIFIPQVQYCWGRGQFKHLFWWKVQINPKILKDDIKKYNYIYFFPYEINFNELSKKFENPQADQKSYTFKNVEDKTYWGKTNENKYPHIDSTTGNIHVDFNPEEWMQNPDIKQLILVRDIPNAHYGPKYNDNKNKDAKPDTNYITISHEDIDVVLPLDCYYPSLLESNTDTGENNSDKNDTAQSQAEKIKNMLNALLNQIKKQESESDKKIN